MIMEKINIAICEDSQEEQKKLLDILSKSKIPVELSIFKCGEDFLKDYQKNKYDLILMDIYMHKMTGVEVVTEVRKSDEDVPIAFITTSTDHTLESYRLNVLKYIEKPVNEKAINELLQLAHIKKESIPKLSLKKNGKELTIPFDKILYAEQQNHTSYIHLIGDEVISVHEKLNDIEEQFDEQLFIRCHKSYMVNLDYIVAIDKELMVFIMKEGENVHIRRESFSKAKKAYENHLFDRTRRLTDE